MDPQNAAFVLLNQRVKFNTSSPEDLCYIQALYRGGRNN